MVEKSVAERRHEELLRKIEGVDGQIEIMKQALVGTDEKPGYFERVRSLEKWQAAQKKIYWGLLGIIGVDIVTRAIDLLK